jgi:hypothetical protein
MGWIKRNLFLVVGGLLTLLFLGGAGFYIFKGWSGNSEASSTLNELYDKLQQYSQEPIQPGNDKTDNVKTAKEQEQQMRDWINLARQYFQPIASIPQGEVTSKTYATALNNTVNLLQLEAKDNSVTLPPQYNFSFQVQSTKLTISSGLEPLAQQLGEVKAITEILFAARINQLNGIQRVRVSDDDANGLQADYIDNRPITNELAVITPYVLSFDTFSPELGKVLSGFASSTNGYIVKSVSVQPSNAAGASPAAPNYPGQYPPGPGGPEGVQRGGINNYQRGMGRFAEPVPQQPPPVAAAPSKGGLQTVLKEQLLHITLEVDIVKLLPKS